MSKLLNTIFGDPNKKMLATLHKDVEKINHFEPAIQALFSEQLKEKTILFRDRLAKGETLDDLLF